jgi:hypothetical protein
VADARRAALEIVASRLRDAQALLTAIGRLRRILDRYDWLGPGWAVSGSGGVVTAWLKDSMIYVESRSVVQLADDLDLVRIPVLAVINPPVAGGIGQEDRDRLRQILDGLTRSATKATRHRLSLQNYVVTALLIAAGIGFVLGFLIGRAAH